MDLFKNQFICSLADRLRPKQLDEVVGQDHLLGQSGLISSMLAKRRLASMIMWGPPGCGKTTIGLLLSKKVGLEFMSLSAVFSGISDIKKVFAKSRVLHAVGNKGILLFIDEIHRFNRVQQDSLLPVIEDGRVILVGATTENPSFELSASLLSRVQIFVLRRLDDTALDLLLSRAIEKEGRELPVTEDGKATLREIADGDGRCLLKMAEEVFDLSPNQPLDSSGIISRMQSHAATNYKKNREEKYNLISALHKSMRGSDPDAALYWLARMLNSGKDPTYILRRLTRFAVEDVGMADPTAITTAIACWEAYKRLGSPEGDLVISYLVIHLATANKSNATYKAHEAAKHLAKKTHSLMPPNHLLNSPTRSMEKLSYGLDYSYHDEIDNSFSGQNFFPDRMVRQRFYNPVKVGFELEISNRLAYFDSLRCKRRNERT
ncbi:magnesium chelatase, subunit ChlI family protein [Candidatus Endolissoclinum faulkneri L2]|uniref:Replication-associated recombination protein A n=1 Tax=Candidatus Endolissoclinum faulkneri L2 TaxID=1193729 RepID=K7YF94_9PROT|nr:replication-associated recombination protein A [Candidatus Endolissoclinum faulkneri]AFX98250.1 magnesium chelatase, subunit ChlI family protein [Candidatus Endolissoclinum faulkneri L2]